MKKTYKILITALIIILSLGFGYQSFTGLSETTGFHERSKLIYSLLRCSFILFFAVVNCIMNFRFKDSGFLFFIYLLAASISEIRVLGPVPIPGFSTSVGVSIEVFSVFLMVFSFTGYTMFPDSENKDLTGLFFIIVALAAFLSGIVPKVNNYDYVLQTPRMKLIFTILFTTAMVSAVLKTFTDPISRDFEVMISNISILSGSYICLFYSYPILNVVSFLLFVFGLFLNSFKLNTGKTLKL